MPILHGMARSLALVFPLLLCAAPDSAAVAQSPVPAGETTAGRVMIWTGEDAMLWWWLQDAAATLQAKGPGALPRVHGGHGAELMPGFVGSLFTWQDTQWDTRDPEDSATPWLLYLWPGDRAAARFAFCLGSSGRALVSTSHAGYRGADVVPEPHAATGAGSRRGPQDLLDLSGKGCDGKMWETAQTLRTVPQEYVLQDEHGVAWPQGRILVAPLAWIQRDRTIFRVADAAPLDRPGPAGTAVVHAGRARLQGPPATGLYLCAGEGESLAMLSQSQVRGDGDALVLTMPRGVLQRARLQANESAAIATLKNISSAQAQCQASGVIDANGNGAGEYGCFIELAGAVEVRGRDGALTDQKISPPVLSAAFRNQRDGVVQRSGYCFRIWLPGKDGTPVTEAADGGGMQGIAVDPVRAEVLWCAYAWPVEAGVSGQRAFFVNQAGDVLACANANGVWSGPAAAPPALAAFAAGEGHLERPVAANANGNDGQRWIVVN